MCKKSETTQSSLKESIKSADSTLSSVNEKIHDINNATGAVFDSAHVKIKEFDNTKNVINEKIEATTKSINSLSDKIASTKLESKPNQKDSVQKKPEKIIVHVPSSKIIKETKVIYKNEPKKESIPGNKLIKTGTLELNVDNAETAKEIAIQEIRKYDGFLRSESISSNNNDRKIAYLRIKVPIQKFEYLMNDLSTIGTVENKGVEVSGQNYVENTMCDLEITLYGKTGQSIADDQPKTFGQQSFTAISSGWNVITAIFLFLLPFWPLFLVAGIAYYFYKKKKKDLSDHHSS